jgi:hypothetical protein
MSTVPEYRVLLSTDIEDYSKRTDAEQHALQEALSSTIDDAASLAGLNRSEWLTQVGGDSITAVLPAGTELTSLMDVFVRELDAGLGSHNRRRAGDAWTRMRLRLAVHAGLVHLDGKTGWSGRHVVLPVRLRDSDPVRTALGALASADLAVVVSADVYRDYITQGPGNPRPTEFRTVVARGKTGSQGQQEEYHAHLLMPGFDVHAMAALARYDVPEVTAPGRAPVSAPDVRAQASPEIRATHPQQPPPYLNYAGRDNNIGSGNARIYTADRDINLTEDQHKGGSDGR